MLIQMLRGIPPGIPNEHYLPINIHGFLNLLFFIAFSALLLIMGLIFLYKAKKQEEESVKRIKLAHGLFGIFYGICRIVFILMFQDFTNPAQNYDLLANIAYSFGMLGFTAIIWALEKVKYETNFFFLISLTLTIITVAGVVLNLFNIAEIRELILIIIMLGTPIAGFFIIILFIQVIGVSSGEVKTKGIYSLVGFLIMVIGITMDGQFFLSIQVIPLWFKMDIVPIFCIGGYLMFAGSQL